MKHTCLRTLQCSALTFLLTAAALADRIELTDGSVVMGKLVSADAGKFKIETSFAGTIDVAQDKIKSFTTDEAVVVGLKGGSTMQGKVEQGEAGIKVIASDGQMSAPRPTWRRSGVRARTAPRLAQPRKSP